MSPEPEEKSASEEYDEAFDEATKKDTEPKKEPEPEPDTGKEPEPEPDTGPEDAEPEKDQEEHEADEDDEDIDALRAQNEALSQRIAELEARVDSKEPAKDEGPLFDDLTPEEKELLEDNPELQGLFKRLVREARKPVVDTSVVSDLQSRVTKLTFDLGVQEAHPDFKGLVASPEFHQEWLPKQPKSVQDAAGSWDVEKAVTVLDKYKAWKAKRKEEEHKQALREKHQKKLEGASGSERGGGTTARGKSPEPEEKDMENYEEGWQEAVRATEAKRRRDKESADIRR